MPRRTDARRKVLEAAERLFREKGYAATGLAEILSRSGAPKGSFYFHFPGGKAQVAQEVLAAYGARVEAWIAEVARRHPLAAFVPALCDGIAEEMRAADWTLGCAAQNIALEADPPLTERAGEVFERWLVGLARGLGHASTSAEARRSAIALLAALQGARSLARAWRSREPFDALKADAVARFGI